MANKDKKNITSFDFGNKAAEKYTWEVAKNIFIRIFQHIIENEKVTSLQAAHFNCGVLHSTFYYLIEKFPELDNFKKDMENFLISRINDNALSNEFNVTASIWRMKQLGEKDRQEIDQKTETTIKMSNKEIEKIDNKLNELY